MINNVRKAIEDLKDGKLIVLIDDDDREAEGDLVGLAELVTGETVNFMAKHARGLICAPVSTEIAKRLNLHSMLDKNTDPHQTAFTVSVDYKTTTTGITAFEKAATIKKLANKNSVLKPRLKANLLMSLLLVRWNEAEKRIFMTGAGHEYLIIYKQRLNKTFKVKSGWVALWMVKDISKILKEVEIKVEPGDIIVLYSDWITEAINRSKRDWTEELFGENRLVEAIQNAPEVPWEWYKTSISVYKSISIALSKFMWYKHIQLDDITLGVIQYKPKNYKPEKDFEQKISDEFVTEWNW